VFVNITGYELAYARAPPNMKSIVMALFLFNTALSQALAELLIPAIKDPHLIVSHPNPSNLTHADTNHSGCGLVLLLL
jgi:POT family proton-dependent oligopeptide transporter